MAKARLTAFVQGHVQGVGFRWWTTSQARELKLAGSASNLNDGRVCVVAEGPQSKCQELLQRLKEQPSEHRRPGHVNIVIEHWGEPRGVEGFVER
ncbi:acylphosphatase [Corynebacterium crudilactis]|uniref:acylphosphatase n=1 Tax=Corynebacterium crudilactis TaxID=1652495 RepID=A0A172QUL1_9CORY|nr:acylphosphatase [Corynebacterium crudilactis]ANE04328.1 acylphosphatase [Corynebacterium crudilactis]